MNGIQTINLQDISKIEQLYDMKYNSLFGSDNSLSSFMKENAWVDSTQTYPAPKEIPDFHAQFEHKFSDTDLNDADHDYIEIDEDWAKQKIGEILTTEQKQILERYNKFHMSLLPDDWEEKFKNFVKATDELSEWRKQFGNLKPSDVKLEIANSTVLQKKLDSINDMLKIVINEKVKVEKK